jgi:hypothetical protein
MSGGEKHGAVAADVLRVVVGLRRREFDDVETRYLRHLLERNSIGNHADCFV